MQTTFEDNFWGEKNNGFYVLYHNMKNGQTSTKEFIDFLRESCAVEEQYCKSLGKLAKGTNNNSNVGTCAPFWTVIKQFIEKKSSLHMQLSHTWSDLMKDMIRYHEEQHKRHKQMKESEHGTLEAVQSIQQTTNALMKAKEIYHTRCIEVERLKRDNASQKDLDKAESKYRKTKDEYSALVEKYENVRNEFEKKLIESCRHFQELEEEHICSMKDFIETYGKSWENEHALLGQVNAEFKVSCDELTVQRILDTFIEAKKTGAVKPGPIAFVEPDLSSLANTRPMSPEPGDKRDSLSDKQKQDAALFTGFLKSKGKKKEKKKKKKEKEDKDEKDAESLDTEPDAAEGSVDVDEEGYRIRPDNPMDNGGDKNSWCSSDSDSDSDGDESKKKIKVEIRPLSANGTTPTGTVEDIKASFEGLRLSPTAARKRCQTPTEKKMKRSQSESDSLDPGKPSQDLLNLDIFASSSASTPTGGNYQLPSPLSPQTEINWSNSSATSASSSTNLGDLLSQSNGMSLAPASTTLPLSTASTALTLSTTSTIRQPTGPSISAVTLPPSAIARPPSRNKGILTQSAKPMGSSPITSLPPMNRSESAGNVTFNTTSMPVGSSRGPSPLTIGMSDTVPLAVAFSETINAYFKGHDATKCIVKIAGTLMLSFPAGVVKVFTDNPYPAGLTFRLKNSSRLEEILPNESLLLHDKSQSTEDVQVFVFTMSALTEHLRQQGEKNKAASYFNIDILKYQVKSQPGVESTPISLVSYWKCEETSTSYRLDYRYNPPAMPIPVTLKQVSIAVNISGGATKMQSIPNGQWNAESGRAVWKLNDISEVSEQESKGTLRAKFDLTTGPSTPSTTALQFLGEGTTLSGVDFELVGPGYRISLTKKRFASGKYYVDAEKDMKYV